MVCCSFCSRDTAFFASWLRFDSINCSPRFFMAFAFWRVVIRWMLDITLKQLKMLSCLNQTYQQPHNKHINQLYALTLLQHDIRCVWMNRFQQVMAGIRSVWWTVTARTNWDQGSLHSSHLPSCKWCFFQQKGTSTKQLNLFYIQLTG